MIAQDVLWYLCEFLDIVEITRYARTNRYILDTINDDFNWKCLADKRIPTLHGVDSSQVRDALSGSITYRELFIALWPFKCSIFGYFGSLYPIAVGAGYLSHCSGSILRIYLEERMIHVIYQDKDLCKSFTLRSHLPHGPGLVVVGQESSSVTGGVVDGQVVIRMPHISETDFYPLPVSNCNVEDPLCGALPGEGSQRLFRGIYGPHGSEIVSTSIITHGGRAAIIEGLKVIGDANVPAGKVSFAVSLEVDLLSSLPARCAGKTCPPPPPSQLTR